MATIEAKLVITWTYEIPDDLDRREELWGTRDLVEAIEIDKQQYEESPELALLELDHDGNGKIESEFTEVQREQA